MFQDQNTKDNVCHTPTPTKKCNQCEQQVYLHPGGVLISLPKAVSLSGNCDAWPVQRQTLVVSLTSLERFQMGVVSR